MTNKNSIDKKKIWIALLSILPAFALFSVFTYYPLVMSAFYSFTDWNGFRREYSFVGFRNFMEALKDTDTIVPFFNTLYFAVIALIIGFILPLMLALILSNDIKGKNALRSVIYVPVIVSGMIVALNSRMFFMYDGIINYVLKAIFQLDSSQIIDWLGSPKTAMNTIIAINAWQWTGYSMVIFMAGMASIPNDVYEASAIDGATGFKKFFKITLPLLMPSITINMFIGITGALKVFDLPYVMTGGGPLNSTNTISMVIYNYAFSGEKFGYASSIGMLFFVLIAIVTILQLRITRRMEVEY